MWRDIADNGENLKYMVRDCRTGETLTYMVRERDSLTGENLT